MERIRRPTRADTRVPRKPGRKKGQTAGITWRRQLFINAYCEMVVPSVYAAFKKAGYRARGAPGRVAAWKVRWQPDVAEAIRERQLRMRAESELTERDILEELKKIATIDVRNLYNGDGSLKALHEIDDYTAAAIAGVDIAINKEGEAYIRKVKTCDRQKALLMYGKHLGMFTPDRTSDNQGAPVELIIEEDKDD